MASEATKRPLIEHFSALKDRRQIWKVVYPLPEIMLLVLCATLAGAEDFVEVRLWGVKNLDFLRRFLPFNDGPPSHDTLNDVINALDPALFKTCLWPGSRSCATLSPTLSPSTARLRGARTTAARAASRCILSPPGRPGSAWCSGRKPPTPSRMRSPPSRCCSSAWPSPEPSSPSTPWAARPRSPTPSRRRARTT